MYQDEFKKFILECIKEIASEETMLGEKENILSQPKPPKLSKPSFMKNNVNKLPKEPKIADSPDSPKTVKIASAPKSSTNENVNKIVNPDTIKILAEEMKKINKKIDLRNPLINPDLFDIISESNIFEKDNGERWKAIYNYEIPDDNLR